MRLGICLAVLTWGTVAFGALENTAVVARDVVRQLRPVATGVVRLGQLYEFLNMIYCCWREGLCRTRPYTDVEAERVLIRSLSSLLLRCCNGMRTKVEIVDFLGLQYDDEGLSLGSLTEARADLHWNAAYHFMFTITCARHLYTLLLDREVYLLPERSLMNAICPICFERNNDNLFIAPCRLATHFLCVHCYVRIIRGGRFRCHICRREAPAMSVYRRAPSLWFRLARLSSAQRMLVYILLCFEVLMLSELFRDIYTYTNSTTLS